MNMKKQFEHTEKLYHFTSSDTALKIIDSKCLRFGKLSNMNDVHESDKFICVDTTGKKIEQFSSDVLDALNGEIHKYRQISLTAEGEPRDKLGFNLHQMWGLYADKGEGVCLVFDKKELLQKLDSNIVSGRVSYGDTVESYHVSFAKNPNDVPCEIKKNTKSIFFHKRIEWEHEQEFRLIKRCPNLNREEYLRYGESLKFIILSSKLCDIDEVRYSKYINTIENCAKGIPILIYSNSLFNYSLATSDGEMTIWNSEEGYDILLHNPNCRPAF